MDGTGQEAPASRRAPAEEEYEEITLADIVRVLHQRKIVLVSVFLVCLLAGVAFTAFATPQYASEATVIPLEHRDIIENWLASRHAAELVVGSLGDSILPTLFPDRWDADAQAWTGEEPTIEAAGSKLASRVTVESASSARSDERFLSITVKLPDPQLSRDAANGYLGTLDDLRPRLENITRQQAFDTYYDGSNEQEAQRRAETTARQKDFWIVLDDPLAGRQVEPNATLNIALSGVLGLFLGVFGAFFVNWLQQYRAEMRELDVPEEHESDQAKPPSSKGQVQGGP